MKIKVKTIQTVIAKTLSIALVIMLVGAHTIRYPVFAQEISPTGEPTDTPTPTIEQTTIDNSAVVDTTSTVTADTGNNTIGTTPTPTPTPDLFLETGISGPTGATGETGPTGATGASETPDTTITTTATETNESSNASSGSASGPTPTPEVNVMTGTAVALTTVDNNVNSTAVNATVIYQTINLYIEQNGTLDLSDPTEFIRSVLLDHPDEPTINLHITSVTNTAAVTTTVSSDANSGNNAMATDGSASLTTGDAFSLISILNRVNLVMIDSVVHIVTINIFGTLNGDIILPVPLAGSGNTCDACGANTNVTNTANVANLVLSTATTGDNTLNTDQNGTVQTGDAGSIVNITNLVNTTLIGGSVFGLYINAFGEWDGNFVGYGDVPSGELGTLIVAGSEGGNQGCCTTNLIATNSATVTNTIKSSATTGGNTVDAKNGSITTGNAVSEVSIINLVNTVLYRTTAFFGFINIFGSWHGNVGDASSLAKAETTPDPEQQTVAETSSAGGPVRETGGLLTMTQTNNVGEYINPGDTVTFFITVQNPGNGRVFDTDIVLHIFINGIDVGGTTVPVGTIKIGGTVKVTTGLELSPYAPGGIYVARAVATGHVGPNNDTVSDLADSLFTISGSWLGASDAGDGTMVVSGSVPPTTQVMGVTTKNANNMNILLALLVLLLLVPQYVLYRATRNRKLLAFVFTSDLNWQARLRAVQTFLL